MQTVNQQGKNNLAQEVLPIQPLIEEPTDAEQGELAYTKDAETLKEQAVVQDDNTNDTIANTPVIPNIVDETNQLTTLHDIVDTNTQTLTTLADKKEQEFIEGVEAAHGHK